MLLIVSHESKSSANEAFLAPNQKVRSFTRARVGVRKYSTVTPPPHTHTHTHTPYPNPVALLLTLLFKPAD